MNNSPYRIVSIAIITLMTLAVNVRADDCTPDALTEDPNRTLACYINDDAEDFTPSWALIEHSEEGNLEVYRYLLKSQVWPLQSMSNKSTQWQHRLTLYKPKTINGNQALLIVNGGTINPIDGGNNSGPDGFDAAMLAESSGTLVINLDDTPNQYLTFDDDVPRREDGIVAYSWNQYLDNPQQSYWSVHLPMTRAIVAAMDASQHISKDQQWPIPEKFVVTGASKRGWAAWLATLIDQRINALLPVVIDILNTQENLAHIHSSFNGWPPAFYDYVSQGVTDRIESDEFSMLMKIEDPLQYKKQKRYRARLAIPKYIISASGDDFFAADSLLQYIDQLPGKNALRAMPNQSHYIDKEKVSLAIQDFYLSFLHQQHLPDLHWSRNAQGQLTGIQFKENAVITPTEIVVWQAFNPGLRDFRLNAGIRYFDNTINLDDLHCIALVCSLSIQPVHDQPGYYASFIEMKFETPVGPITLTTPVIVNQVSAVQHAQ